ncbi:hypothetical protein ACFVWX_33815 [Streptomyces sp. NPDC058220]|uniref:hypothetical protein n=1 Tax=unclassified Streptomyces TaxID=2593676 RepID=UPI003666BD5B
MARSPAPAPRSRRGQLLWPAALLVTLAALAASVLPVTRVSAGAAVAPEQTSVVTCDAREHIPSVDALIGLVAYVTSLGAMRAAERAGAAS